VSMQRLGALTAIAFAVWGPPHPAQAAESSANSISHLELKPLDEGYWQVDFDYFYTGEPQGAVFHIDLNMEAGSKISEFHGPKLDVLPKPGANHVSTSYLFSSEGTSRQLTVRLTTGDWQNPQELASTHVDQLITWPTLDQRNFNLAQNMIDNGAEAPLSQARRLLEGLVARNPQFDPAFVELARIAMKSNWGPEGLHQAETLLHSALDIRPDSANAKILLGYVYANQHRLHDAEALYTDAARSNPPNVWLWVNWGELLEMQGKPDQAIPKYREAISRSKPGYSRTTMPREQARKHLLSLLDAHKNADEVDAVYQQGVKEFGSCYRPDYALFKLNVRGDAKGAIEMASAALNANCSDAVDRAREALGLANYFQWAKDTGTESTAALNQARVYLPPGPMAIFLMANNDSTVPAAKKLLATGEAIDQEDNEQMTALAYALQKGKFDAATRLLKLGANPEAPVGFQAMPVALLPVLEGNLDAIRVLQRAGVDYSKLRFRGATAIDYAKQSGDDALLNALTAKDRSL